MLIRGNRYVNFGVAREIADRYTLSELPGPGRIVNRRVESAIAIAKLYAEALSGRSCSDEVKTAIPVEIRLP
jgi:hypothetical protein